MLNMVSIGSNSQPHLRQIIPNKFTTYILVNNIKASSCHTERRTTKRKLKEVDNITILDEQGSWRIVAKKRELFLNVFQLGFRREASRTKGCSVSLGNKDMQTKTVINYSQAWKRIRFCILLSVFLERQKPKKVIGPPEDDRFVISL